MPVSMLPQFWIPQRGNWIECSSNWANRQYRISDKTDSMSFIRVPLEALILQHCYDLRNCSQSPRLGVFSSWKFTGAIPTCARADIRFEHKHFGFLWGFFFSKFLFLPITYLGTVTRKNNLSSVVLQSTEASGK